MKMPTYAAAMAVTLMMLAAGPLAAEPDSGAGTTGKIPGDAQPGQATSEAKANTSMMKKTKPDGAGENKQTPTGGQPGGGAGKS